MGKITGYDALTTPATDDELPIYVNTENLTYKIDYSLLLPKGMLNIAGSYTASNTVTDYTLVSGKIWQTSNGFNANFSPLPSQNIVFGIWNDSSTTQTLASTTIANVLQNGLYFAGFITLQPEQGGVCYYFVNTDTLICLGMYIYQ